MIYSDYELPLLERREIATGPVSPLTELFLCTAGDYEKQVKEASPHRHNRAKMDAKEKKQSSSSVCFSMKSDKSKEDPPYFSHEEGYVYN